MTPLKRFPPCRLHATIAFALLLGVSPWANAVFTASAVVSSPLGNSPADCNVFAADAVAECGGAGMSADGRYLVSGGARAWGDAFGLHAVSEISVNQVDHSEPPAFGTALGEVSLQDYFTFDGPRPLQANISITMETHGHAVNGYGQSQLNLDAVECSYYDAGTCTVTELVNLNVGFRLNMFLAAMSGSGGGVLGGAYFADTARVSSISFEDLDGNPLSLSYTTASGLTYPMPVISVPEPSAYVLMMAGLVAVSAATRQRRIRPTVRAA